MVERDRPSPVDLCSSAIPKDEALSEDLAIGDLAIKGYGHCQQGRLNRVTGTED